MARAAKAAAEERWREGIEALVDAALESRFGADEGKWDALQSGLEAVHNEWKKGGRDAFFEEGWVLEHFHELECKTAGGMRMFDAAHDCKVRKRVISLFMRYYKWDMEAGTRDGVLHDFVEGAKDDGECARTLVEQCKKVGVDPWPAEHCVSLYGMMETGKEEWPMADVGGNAVIDPRLYGGDTESEDDKKRTEQRGESSTAGAQRAAKGKAKQNMEKAKDKPTGGTKKSKSKAAEVNAATEERTKSDTEIEIFQFSATSPTAKKWYKDLKEATDAWDKFEAETMWYAASVLAPCGIFVGANPQGKQRHMDFTVDSTTRVTLKTQEDMLAAVVPKEGLAMLREKDVPQWTPVVKARYMGQRSFIWKDIFSSDYTDEERQQYMPRIINEVLLPGGKDWGAEKKKAAKKKVYDDLMEELHGDIRRAREAEAAAVAAAAEAERQRAEAEAEAKRLKQEALDKVKAAMAALQKVGLDTEVIDLTRECGEVLGGGAGKGDGFTGVVEGIESDGMATPHFGTKRARVVGDRVELDDELVLQYLRAKKQKQLDDFLKRVNEYDPTDAFLEK